VDNLKKIRKVLAKHNKDKYIASKNIYTKITST